MKRRFESKVVLITGGTSGMGWATALAFASQGSTVVLAARRSEGSDELIAALKSYGGEALFVQTDITDASQVEQLINTVVEHYDRLDIAFNNAGYGGMTVPCADFLESVWDATIDVNLKGVWLCMKYQIRAMLKTGGGAIVNNSSAAGLNGGPATGVAYCASKHGVVGLTKAAAAEYAKSGIRINAICPGVIGTPMAEQSFGQAAGNQSLIDRHPIGRIGRPEEIASTVLFLCSEEAPFLIGAAIPIDGGLTLDN